MSMVVLGRGGRGVTEAEADTDASPGFAGEPASILEASRQGGGNNGRGPGYLGIGIGAPG